MGSNSLRHWLLRATLTIVLLATWAFPCDANAPKGSSATTYTLPFEGRDVRGFCTLGNKLFMFHHPTRTLYAVNGRGLLEPVEDLSGWAVSDVAIVDRAAVYCSRDRMLRKVRGKVAKQTVPGTTNLISIATDGRKIYLLDATDTPAILCLDARTGKQLSRVAYDGYRPVDLAVNENGLLVLDLGDRCVHQVDARSGTTMLKIQVGPGIASGSGGIAVIGKSLYVHESDFQRLRELKWKAESAMVSSWTMPIKMTFVQESDNEHDTDTTRVDFEVPLPAAGFSQEIDKLQWSQQPDDVTEDRFGQKIARFRNIEIAPKQHHQLTYQTTVYPRAVQYDPPPAPLSALEEIAGDIKNVYLAPDPVYHLDSPELIQAANEARLDADGKEPADVRSLIENIAWYESRKLSYVMDGTWDDALTVFERGTGSCTEYSFVFSSLCRLNRIPTRLMGGIQFGDYRKKHEADGFHRWTEVYFPKLGWVPVDVTKFDDANEKTRDREFLFGTPGYLICLSRGGIDRQGLGMAYYINRHYRGGKRVRRTYVLFEPHPSEKSNEVVLNIR